MIESAGADQRPSPTTATIINKKAIRSEQSPSSGTGTCSPDADLDMDLDSQTDPVSAEGCAHHSHHYQLDSSYVLPDEEALRVAAETISDTLDALVRLEQLEYQQTQEQQSKSGDVLPIPVKPIAESTENELSQVLNKIDLTCTHTYGEKDEIQTVLGLATGVEHAPNNTSTKTIEMPESNADSNLEPEAPQKDLISTVIQTDTASQDDQNLTKEHFKSTYESPLLTTNVICSAAKVEKVISTMPISTEPPPSSDEVFEAIQNDRLAPEHKMHLVFKRLAFVGRQPLTSASTEIIMESRRLNDCALQIMITDDLTHIRHGSCVRLLFRKYIRKLSLKITAEILSVLAAVLKKSLRNLQACQGVLVPALELYCNPIELASDFIPGNETDQKQQEDLRLLLRHLLFELIAALIQYSCDVKELKQVLIAAAQHPPLLQLLRSAHSSQANRPSSFFSLPATSAGSFISLPPVARWPIAHGWSFVCWFRLESCAPNAQPHLFAFRSSRSGAAFCAHFAGSCLVISVTRQKSKSPVQLCVPFEFDVGRWFHCAVSFGRSWRSSELKVYVNGQLACGHELQWWPLVASDPFDRCSIGGTADQVAVATHAASSTISSQTTSASQITSSLTASNRPSTLFCGQLSTIYLLQESLTAAQVCAMHRLGPNYCGQYRHPAETSHAPHLHGLPPTMRRTLYEQKLSASLFAVYSPVAVESDRLCVQCAPSSGQPHFQGSAHAMLTGHATAIRTHSLADTLQSLGGVRALLPLLARFAGCSTEPLSAAIANGVPSLPTVLAEVCIDATAVSTLIGFICDLLASCPFWFGNEALQSHTFVVIASLLSRHSRRLITEQTLEALISLSRTLMGACISSEGDSLLLKQLMDSVLFNPSLWIYADARLQLKLYAYLSGEFLSAAAISSSLSGESVQSQCSSAGTASTSSATTMATSASSNANSSPNSSSTAAATTSGGSASIGCNQNNSGFVFSEVRRISTVLQLLHSLKYYYWLVPEDQSEVETAIVLYQSDGRHVPVGHEQNESFSTTELQHCLQQLGMPMPPTSATARHVQSSNSTIASVRVKAKDMKQRPNREQLLAIRQHMLHLLKALVLRGPGVHHDELQALLNFASTVRVDLNLLDVLHTLQQLMAEQPAAMVPAFDSKHGVRTVFRLLEAPAEPVRLAALRLLGHFLARSTGRRKQDVMGPHNLFMLLHERLLPHTPLSMNTYLALFELLVERQRPLLDEMLRGEVQSESNSLRIENPMVLKVIAMLLIDGRPGQHVLISACPPGSAERIAAEQRDCIRRRFLADLWNLLAQSRNNRRLVLQMSVWQHWLINLLHDRSDALLKDQVLALFRLLLYHAVKFEYGGWRVWIDTLAIIHSKVSWDEFLSQFGDYRHHPVCPVPIQNNARFINDPADEMDTAAESLGLTALSETKVTERTPLGTQDITADDVEIEHEDMVQDAPIAPSTSSIVDEETPCSEATARASHPQISTISLQDEKIERSPDESDVAPTRSFRRSKPNESEMPLDDKTGLLSNELGAEMSSTNTTATPAFRMPEFRWSELHIQLLNDLLYSIEADVQSWRNQSMTANLSQTTHGTQLLNPTKDSSKAIVDDNGKLLLTATSSGSQLDHFLQHPDNQIYIVNAIHLISQLSDNVILAAGGLLPLLASATGGSSSGSGGVPGSNGGDGLSAVQANQLLYRLAHLADVLCFAATHVSLCELEVEKSMSAGGILRQCLRLVCTVAVKNCLIVQQHRNEYEMDAPRTTNTGPVPPESADECGQSLGPAVSISQAARLFRTTAEDGTLIENVGDESPESGDYMDWPAAACSAIPPIREPQKLLQELDVNRLRACIYRDPDADAKQTQFLALASLYFVSVLMVSRYRDIIEPSGSQARRQRQQQPSFDTNGSFVAPSMPSFAAGPFPERRPEQDAAFSDRLTARLEAALGCVCPLLRELVCDFAGFLSRTLLGSHGQDLVGRQALRTFRRASASPVEAVMLLCSQEWQNTLQKNAGLAFIELINDGRVLGQAAKEHLLRVACEAELIVDRLRADDVCKHEVFAAASAHTAAARAHEEALIHSLICAAQRRDRLLFTRFKSVATSIHSPLNHFSSQFPLTNDPSSYKQNGCTAFRLDSWEDDSRRRRRFVLDTFGTTADKLIESDESKSIDNSIEKDCTPIVLPPAPSSSRSIENPHHAALASDDVEEDVDDEIEAEDDDNDSTVGWPNDADRSSSPNAEADEEMRDLRPPGAEFADSLLASLPCAVVWSIYTVEGTLQVTASELVFEPSALSERYDPIDSSGGGRTKVCAVNPRTDEAVRALLGRADTPITNPLVALDVAALRYCELLTGGGRIALADIRAVFSRRFLGQPTALELFLAQRTSVLFAFIDPGTVRRLVRLLPPVGVGVKYGITQSRRASLMPPRQLFASSDMTARWQRREVSNFEYLMFLNTIAGRSFQDLGQYPVFPWVLADYESDRLDLSQPSSFRDLSRPVGALNAQRRRQLLDRYARWERDGPVPPFHHGSHYSTAAFTLGWLLRLQPFRSAYVALHDGRLEPTGRRFDSLPDSWLGALLGGSQNVRELIPELFYLPELFTGAGFGELPQSALPNPLRSVRLPKWAQSAEHFIRVHRMALESELVSCQLHQWIDLIFGYKQRGPEAVRAVNVFYYLTYEGAVDLRALQPTARQAVEAQLRHFGQTPAQLTSEPHPPRASPLHVTPLMFSPVLDELCMSVKFASNAPLVHLAACAPIPPTTAATTSGPSSHPGSGQNLGYVAAISSNLAFNFHRWNAKDSPQQPLLCDPALTTSINSPGATSSISGTGTIGSSSLASGSSSGSGSSATISSALGSGRRNQTLQFQETGGGISSSAALQVVVSVDGRHIIVAPFFDNSFRVFATDTGRLSQVVFGHRAPVTCLARSECNVLADFYVASGARDCCVLLWTWNASSALIEGAAGMSGNTANSSLCPLPKLTLTGHETEVSSLLVSAELGLVVSGSRDRILLHTTSAGDCVCAIDVKTCRLGLNPTTSVSCSEDTSSVSACDFIGDAKEASFEASVIGSDGRRPQSNSSNSNKFSLNSVSIEPNPWISSASLVPSNLHQQLATVSQEQLLVTNLALSRELSFVVGIALPIISSDLIDDSSSSSSSSYSSKSRRNRSTGDSKRALLFTYNLRGQLMRCVCFFAPSTAPLLTLTRDGEYALLAEGASTVQIVRVFDLTPLYALSTSDACPSVSPLSPDLSTTIAPAAVRSLLLMEYRYLLVGLDNGRLLVYNIDFNRWHHQYSSRY